MSFPDDDGSRLADLQEAVELALPIMRRAVDTLHASARNEPSDSVRTQKLDVAASLERVRRLLIRRSNAFLTDTQPITIPAAPPAPDPDEET